MLDKGKKSEIHSFYELESVYIDYAQPLLGQMAHVVDVPLCVMGELWNILEGSNRSHDISTVMSEASVPTDFVKEFREKFREKIDMICINIGYDVNEYGVAMELINDYNVLITFTGDNHDN